MKIRAMTETVSGTKNSSFIVSTIFPPIGGSIEIEGNIITVRTFGCETKISPDNYKVFRFYKWWAILNYRVIVEYEGGYRAVDFRGRGKLHSPTFFTDLGYEIEVVERFWRRSFDGRDGDCYGLEFSLNA